MRFLALGHREAEMLLDGLDALSMVWEDADDYTATKPPGADDQKRRDRLVRKLRTIQEGRMP